MRKPLLVSCLLALAAFCAHAQEPLPPPVSLPAAEGVQGTLLESGLDTIEKNFIEALPREQLEAKALGALLEKLDPYSRYLDADELALFRADMEAGFGGIGVSLFFEDPSGYPRVDYLIYGGDALRAGIVRGDLLLAVDGMDTKGLTFDPVGTRLRGKVGTEVAVRIRRSGEAAPREFQLKRNALEMPSVRSLRRDADGQPDWWLDRARGLGYLRISNVATDTPRRVDMAVGALVRGGARGLVLDLRDCSGGLMKAALATADLFVERGRLLSIRQRGKADETFEAKPGKYGALPIVGLVNVGTASSCEILAGALSDNGRARLVGENTFGKGRIQVLYNMGPGRGGAIVSTGTFQRPNGKTIDRYDFPEAQRGQAGIAPEVVVKMDEAAHAAWLEFAEKTTGTMILTREEQQGGPPDPVLVRAVQLLGTAN